MATEMPAAISPYSIAVAARSSLKNRTRLRIDVPCSASVEGLVY
jgi:hypothetical protein